MEILWQELTAGVHGSQQLERVLLRLVAAVLLGALLGLQRESTRKPAGLRTHMLVCLGTAVFISCGTAVGMPFDGLSRVIQGIATGIGFIGAGSILKLSAEREIKGLTTAASVWMTASIGVTVGLGALGIALIATILALIILSLAKIERRLEKKMIAKAKDAE
jgi:putative Mg2+ transporter-C (MgtC) family protein